MISICAAAGIPEVMEGDDLASLVLDACARAGTPLQTGDVVVVTSKIVSKAEGRAVPAAGRENALAGETVRVVATREREGGGTTRIVESRLGIVGASVSSSATRSAARGVTDRPASRSEPPGARVRRARRAGRRGGTPVARHTSRPRRRTRRRGRARQGQDSPAAGGDRPGRGGRRRRARPAGHPYASSVPERNRSSSAGRTIEHID